VQNKALVSGFVIFFGRLWLGGPKEINAIRCDPLRSEAAVEAPLDQWQQIGEFETLAACRAAYEKQQAPAPKQDEFTRVLAKSEFLTKAYDSPRVLKWSNAPGQSLSIL
jgi:hypothetical protein